jgi:hypothetical protein
VHCLRGIRSAKHQEYRLGLAPLKRVYGTDPIAHPFPRPIRNAPYNIGRSKYLAHLARDDAERPEDILRDLVRLLIVPVGVLIP